MNTLVDVVQKGKRFRLVGDNINWQTKVHNQRFDRRGGMTNAFTSAAVVQEVYFPDLDTSPHLNAFTTDVYLMSADDCSLLKSLYVRLIIEIISRHLPSIAFVNIQPGQPFGGHSSKLVNITQVIPLPVLYYNEQVNSDVIKIMSWYSDVVEEVYKKAGVDMESVHAGGDQLTRVRFSSAKRLRATALEAKDRFELLKPITFEFFHLQMKLVDYMFKVFYTDRSTGSIGTMFNSRVKLNRTQVSSNTYHTFDDNRDFAVAFTDAYIAEGLMEMLGMDSPSSNPTKYSLPLNANEHDKQQWLEHVVGIFVDNFVLTEAVKRFGNIASKYAWKYNYKF